MSAIYTVANHLNTVRERVKKFEPRPTLPPTISMESLARLIHLLSGLMVLVAPPVRSEIVGAFVLPHGNTEKNSVSKLMPKFSLVT